MAFGVIRRLARAEWVMQLELNQGLWWSEEAGLDQDGLDRVRRGAHRVDRRSRRSLLEAINPDLPNCTDHRSTTTSIDLRRRIVPKSRRLGQSSSHHSHFRSPRRYFEHQTKPWGSHRQHNSCYPVVAGCFRSHLDRYLLRVIHR